jgi:hypothetical protein
MPSSASAICDALVTMLTSSSVLGASMASVQNWSVLEKASACCAVVGFQGYQETPIGFGGDTESNETYFINAYVKDTANVANDLNNIQTLVTKVANCISADNSLLDTVDMVLRFTANHRPGYANVIGGFAWLPIECLVEVKQL